MHTSTKSFWVVLVAFAIISVLLVLAKEDRNPKDEVHVGSYGYVCTDECRKRGYSYNWCNAEHPESNLPGITYWDYCSKKEDFDYQGRRCWQEHACGNHGYKYKWCYTGEDGSSWGYCGLNVTKTAFKKKKVTG